MKIIDKNIAEQTRGIFRNPSTGSGQGPNEWRDIPPERGRRQVLTDEEILELSELVVKIEQHYGFPVDVEWARDTDGKFYIVQSRPITTLQKKDTEPKQKIFSVLGEDRDVALNPWCALNDVFRKSLFELSEGNVPPLDNMFYFEKEKVLWGADADRFADAGQYFSERLRDNPDFIDTIADELKDTFEQIKTFTEELLKTDLHKKSNKQLLGLYQQNYQIWLHMWAWGLIGQFVDMGENKLSDTIKSAICQKLERFGNAEVVFSKLLTPTQPSMLAEEVEAVLEMAQEVQCDKALQKLVLQTKKYEELPQSIVKKLETLTRLFGWLQYYYLGPAATPAYYFNLLKRKIKTSATEALKDRKKEKMNLTKFQTEVSDVLDDTEKRSIDSLRELSLLKEVRKEYSFLLNFAMDAWYREVAHRFSLDPLHLHYLLPTEFEKMLTHDALPVAVIDLQERYKCSAYMMIDGQDKIYAGVEARKLRERYMPTTNEMPSETETLKGSVAYQGIAQGIVKIINSKSDMDKFVEGDILVSISTNPSLVSAMNKAAAIVTDTGGITCHAAIVSRELKIPCVVGTKIATQVLHDGDLVEVDAERGVVTILKRAANDTNLNNSISIENDDF